MPSNLSIDKQRSHSSLSIGSSQRAPESPVANVKEMKKVEIKPIIHLKSTTDSRNSKSSNKNIEVLSNHQNGNFRRTCTLNNC